MRTAARLVALLLVALAGAAAADAPRWGGTSVLAMWTHATSGPVEVSTTNPLPITITGAIPSPSITGTVSGGATYTSVLLSSPTISSPTLSGTVSGTPTIASAWTWSTGQTFPTIAATTTISGASLSISTGTGISVPSGGNGYTFASAGYFIAVSDGVFKMSNTADTGFTRLVFSANTAAGSAIVIPAAVSSKSQGIIITNGLGTAAVVADLGAATNGSMIYCSDCTIASPCAGGGSGALAKRLNGVWVCN